MMIMFMSISAAMFTALQIGCSAHDSKKAEPADGGEDSVDGGFDSGLGKDSDKDAGSDCFSSISLISAETSSVIGTVGIVEWSTSINPVSSAYIEFGLDTDYGYTAPADLNAANYRTLLLGMKPSKTYHYRIVVNGCASDDHTIETGPRPTNLPDKTVSVEDSTLSAGGFIVTSTGMTDNYAYILDKDGDYVWWYSFNADAAGGRMDGLSRAKMSADGKFMWAGSTNVGCGCGYLFKVAMDGLGEQETTAVNRHHDFTVLPDNSVVYIEYTDNGDRIVERGESGETRTVYNLSEDFSGSTINWSHCNSIHYYPRDDSYTVSCLGLNNIIKIDRASGALVWNLQGDAGGDFSGVTWDGQHGHQLLDNGNILFFSNGGASRDETDGSDGIFDIESSEALELSLDLSSAAAFEIWSCKGGAISLALGDVQRISNGNTLVTYSLAGKIHEVAPSKALIRSISVEGIRYTNWRPTLYGEPYRY